jgi:hypothetical protein
MFRPGFEPGTVCVLDRRDNQLHHRNMDFVGVYRSIKPNRFVDESQAIPWREI